MDFVEIFCAWLYVHFIFGMPGTVFIDSLKLLLTVIIVTKSVAQPGFGGGGHRGSGERKAPRGSRGRAPGGWFGKLIAVIKDIWLPNHAQFCVFSSTAQPGIFL